MISLFSCYLWLFLKVPDRSVLVGCPNFSYSVLVRKKKKHKKTHFLHSLVTSVAQMNYVHLVSIALTLSSLSFVSFKLVR